MARLTQPMSIRLHLKLAQNQNTSIILRTANQKRNPLHPIHDSNPRRKAIPNLTVMTIMARLTQLMGARLHLNLAPNQNTSIILRT